MKIHLLGLLQVQLRFSYSSKKEIKPKKIIARNSRITRSLTLGYQNPKSQITLSLSLSSYVSLHLLMSQPLYHHQHTASGVGKWSIRFGGFCGARTEPPLIGLAMNRMLNRTAHNDQIVKRIDFTGIFFWQICPLSANWAAQYCPCNASFFW